MSTKKVMMVWKTLKNCINVAFLSTESADLQIPTHMVAKWRSVTSSCEQCSRQSDSYRVSLTVVWSRADSISRKRGSVVTETNSKSSASVNQHYSRDNNWWVLWHSSLQGIESFWDPQTPSIILKSGARISSASFWIPVTQLPFQVFKRPRDDPVYCFHCGSYLLFRVFKN